MNLREFMYETNMSQRKVEYWVEKGFDIATNVPGKPMGIGYPLSYKEEAIPAIKLCNHVHRMLGGRIELDVLKDIFDAYLKGVYDLGEGVTIRWKVDHGTIPTSDESFDATW